MGTTMYNAMQPAGYSAITASSAATAVQVTIAAASAASTTQPEPNYAIFISSASCWWRDDGTLAQPGGTGGMKWPANTPLYYDASPRRISFATDAGVTAVIYASLYRAGP